VFLGSFVDSKCDGVNLGKMMKVSNTGFSSLFVLAKQITDEPSFGLNEIEDNTPGLYVERRGVSG
jgi:hypothetical protein